MNDIEELPQKQVTITMLHCLRCGKTWIPRKETLPKNCPECNSPYWNKPRRVKKTEPKKD